MILLISGLPAITQALSTLSQYGTILFGSKPADAVITTLGRVAFILLPNSSGANPPNTTEWIAPSLPQAYIAIKASGIIGI